MVLSIDRWVGKVAVVTGASSGIGAALVEQLVDSGLKVVGLDRQIELLENASKKYVGKKGHLQSIKCDVSNEEEVLKVFQFIKENLEPISILVNCAGVIGNTNLVEGDTQIWKEIFDVNVIGLCMVTREAVKNMRANNTAGHIIHINSIAGHKVPYFPTSNVYPASKYAVTALAETLRIELNTFKSNIKITSVSPGLVASNIGKNFPDDHPMHKVLKTFPVLQPEDVADAVFYALSTPPHVQIHEVTIKPLNEDY